MKYHDNFCVPHKTNAEIYKNQGVIGQQIAMPGPQQGPQPPPSPGTGVNSPNQQQFLLTYQQRPRGPAGPNQQPTQVFVRNSQGLVQYASTRVLAVNQQQGGAAGPSNAEGSQPPTPGPQPNTIQIQFFGHNPNIKGQYVGYVRRHKHYKMI
jgi:hypothetical protein